LEDELTGSTGLQQKNMTDATWTASNPLNTARNSLAGCRYSNCRFSFWGYDTTITGATEEYDGATWTSNPTGLNTARGML
jgi:hypothetical protein